MKNALDLLVRLLTIILSSENVSALVNAALMILEAMLGADSKAYTLISRVVRHCEEHGCFDDLIGILKTFLKEGFTGPVVVTPNNLPASLATISPELDDIKDMVEAEN